MAKVQNPRGGHGSSSARIVGKVWVPLKYREKKRLSRGTAGTEPLSQRPEKHEKNEKIKS